MADTTTRMPIGLEEVAGTATAATTTAGSVPVEVNNGAGDEIPIDVALMDGAALAATTTAGSMPVEINNGAGDEIPFDLALVDGTALATPANAGNVPVEVTNTASEPIPVTVGAAAGTKQEDYQTASVLKNLGTATLDFADITAATTGKLLHIHGFSQVQMKLTINTDAGGTPTTKLVTGTPSGGGPFDFAPIDIDAITQAGGVGNNFQIVAVNLDKNKDADIHAWAEWTEV